MRLSNLACLLVLCIAPWSNAATTQEAICGTWVLQQDTSPAELNADKYAINNALATPRVRGLSFRTSWAAIDTSFSLLDSAKDLSDAKGLVFTPRFMAGRWVPQRMFTNGCPFFLNTEGEKVPYPFNTDGSPNAVFETEYDLMASKLAAWCRTNGVRIMHMPWYGKDWAELYNGQEIQKMTGYSVSRFIQSHERLMDIALKYAGPDLAVEFPFSGHGPLTSISNTFADYIIAKIGRWNPMFFCQANGWGPNGDWGAPTSDIEDAFDVIFTKPICRGEQMIQPQDYDWTKVYQHLYENNATYCEVYAPSFGNSQPNKAKLISEIAKFADHVENLQGKEPERGNFTEPFDVAAWTPLDSNAANNETVQHALDTATLSGSNYVWGAYAAPGGAGTAQIGLAKANDTLLFNPGAVVAGSRAYTRFDTSPGTAGQKNSFAFLVNAGAPTARMELTVYDNTNAGLQMAVLVRDSKTWWRSSPKAIPLTASTPVVVAFNFGGSNAVSWTEINITTGGGADMDEVDAAGEGSLATTSGGTIDLPAIGGIGVIITAPGTTGTRDLQIAQLSLVAPEPPPTIPTAVQAHWWMLR